MSYEDIMLYGIGGIVILVLIAIIIFVKNSNNWGSKKKNIFAGICAVILIGLIYSHSQFTASLAECKKLPATVVIDIRKIARIDAGRCHYRGIGEHKQWGKWQYYVEGSIGVKNEQRIWIDVSE